MWALKKQGVHGRDDRGSRILRIEAEQSHRLDVTREPGCLQGTCNWHFWVKLWEALLTELKELVLLQGLHVVLCCGSTLASLELVNIHDQ